MNVLVTGAGGFIGSHFIEHVLTIKPDWKIYATCSFHHGGMPERLSKSERTLKAIKDGTVKVITADLARPISRQFADQLSGIDFIVNFASRSHVDTSLTDPHSFFSDNIQIALNMLELAKEIKPKVFVQISTDEVYGPASEGVFHKEWSVIAPSNPYSASKASQEAAAFAWWRAYGVPVIITNTMNNIGERQDPEKFVPLVMKSVLSGETIKIHSIKDNEKLVVGSRYYLHARNHADAVCFLLEKYENCVPKYIANKVMQPLRFNVVGDMEVDNLSLAQAIAQYLGKPLKYEQCDVHSTRPGHDLRYALDGSKLANLGWKAPVEFWESLKRTVEWTKANPEWLL